MIARLWSWLTRSSHAETTQYTASFVPEEDDHIKWLRQQRHDSEESTLKARRDWADVSIQERLGGSNDPRERVR